MAAVNYVPQHTTNWTAKDVAWTALKVAAVAAVVGGLVAATIFTGGLLPALAAGSATIYGLAIGGVVGLGISSLTAMIGAPVLLSAKANTSSEHLGHIGLYTVVCALALPAFIVMSFASDGAKIGMNIDIFRVLTGQYRRI